MINSLHVKDFKALQDISIDLSRLQVLIGPNDAGKSSILQALFAIVHSVEHEIAQCFPGLWNGRDLVWAHASEPLVEIGVDVETRLGNVGYIIEFEFGPGDREVHVTHERVFFESDEFVIYQGRARRTQLHRAVANRDEKIADERRVFQELYDSLIGVHSYRWDPRFLALPTSPDPKWRYRMQPTGFGLPRCLDDILGYDRRQFDTLEKRFIEIFPDFESIHIIQQAAYKSAELQGIDLPQLQQTEGKGVTFSLKDDGAELAASQVSDGVLIILAYLTILYLPQPPRVLLMEEPENGIHPARLNDIIAMLRELILKQDRTQLVMTTHSPYVVDSLKPEEVTLCRKDDRGAVQVRQLSTVPSVHRQLDVFQLGEIWTGEGDDALASEGPSAGAA